VKRSGRDEPVQVVTHMCMEAMLKISLCSYLYLKLQKTLSFLLFNKIIEQEEGRGGGGGKNNVYTCE
jgi:hypothetical protein